MKVFKKFTKRKLASSFLVFIVFIGAASFTYVKFAYGVTRTWDGGGTEVSCPGNANGWSCAQNWSADTAPTAADTAAFDNTSDKDAIIDSSFTGTVDGVDINSGYDGTITQERSLTIDNSTGFDQAAGIWNGGSQTLDINDGGFIVSGGQHIATTGTWTIEHSFTHSGGVLTMSGATVTIDSATSIDDTTMTCSGVLGGTVVVSKASGGDFTLASGCSISLGGTASVQDTTTINGTASGSNLSTEGSLTVGSGGELVLSGTLSFIDTSSTDDATLTCTGYLGVANAISVVKDQGGDFTLASNCSVRLASIDNESGTITINGTALGTNINTEGSLTVGSGGELVLSGTLTFDDTSSTDDATLTCTGHLSTANAISVVKDQGGDFTLASNCNITLASIDNENGLITINGTASGTNINTEGSFTIGSAGNLTLSGALTMDGTSSLDDATLNCNGRTIAGNVTINKTSSTGETTIGGSCTITGNLTRTDGPILNPASALTLSVQGNFSMSTTDTFAGTNLTINMGGSGTQTISQNAGTFSPLFTVNKSGGSASLSTAFSPQSTCTVVEGVFDINGQTFACSSTFTVEDGGTLKLIGSESPTSPTLNSGSTVSYKGASGTNSYTIKNWSYSNLEIAQAAGTNTFNMPADLAIPGNVNIVAGTLDTASGSNFNLTIGGNWNNTGTFTPRSGTVTFNDNSKLSIITGNTTFNNLTSTTANKRFVFGNGSTQTISTALTLNGARGQYISLTSKNAGTQWNIVSNGSASLSYLEVKDSNACGGTTLVPTDSVNLGNNNCWTLPASTGTNDIKINQGIRINQGTNIRSL